MKKILFFFLPILLHAFSLEQYLLLATKQSNDSYDIIDSNTLSKMNVQSVQNRYKIKFTPNSYATTSNDKTTMSVGIDAKREFTTGTTLYGGSSILYSDYDRSPNEYGLHSKVGIKQSLLRKYGEKYNTLSLYEALENDKLQKINARDKMQKIIIRAAKYYYDVQLIEKKEVIYKESLKRSLKNLHIAQKKHEIGLVPKTDVFRANLTYLGQQQNAIIAQEELELAFSDARIYINLKEYNPLHVDENISILQWNPQKIEADDILSKNPAWQGLLVRENFLSRRLYNAKRDLLPDVTLDANYHLSSSDTSLSNITDNSKDSFNISLGSNYDFDMLDEKQSIQKIIIEQNKLLRTKNLLKQTILKHLKHYKTRYYSLEHQLNIAFLKRKDALHSQKIAQARYKRGLASNLDITDAEIAFSNADIEYYATIVNFNINILEFARELDVLDLNFVKKVLTK